ncbi:MAG: hypothetical protein QQN41_08145 [Nitrosopumilus sp.]
MMFENEIINNWEKKQEEQLLHTELIAMIDKKKINISRIYTEWEKKQETLNETKSREI